jgi:CBS domain containing-hemolysin-like protein
MQTLLTVLFGGLTLLMISLHRSYSYLPEHELKRRARYEDPLAKLLFKAVAYGPSLRALLWLLIGASGAGFFVTVNATAPVWFAFFASMALIWLGFAWLPAKRVTRYSNWLAGRAAPVLAWLLRYLHPFLNFCIRQVRRFTPVHVHTGVYEKDDLIQLLQAQSGQHDNRINPHELDLAIGALSLSDKLVRDYLTPRSVVKSVRLSESVGPVLMSELHDSGHSRFPVVEDDETIVGTLYLRDLVKAKSTGSVRELMRPDVFFVHEEQSLLEAVQAVLKTRHQLFVVVNSFEEYVGIITFEDILRQIFGNGIGDEFDQYDDLRAVAQKLALPQHEQHEAATKKQTEAVLENQKLSA